MKTKIFSFILSAAALLGCYGCSDSWQPKDDPDVKGTGRLNTASIGIEVDGAETTVSDNQSAKSAARNASKNNSSRATITLDNFIVTVTNSSGVEVERWTYATMPSLPVFPVGDYTITVKSHEVEPAQWNAPYYEGSQKFTIQTDKITEVEKVTCTLSNIRVSVFFADDLKAAIDNGSEATVKVTSEGNNSLVFTPAETRSGYFAALKDLETLRVDFSASINGNLITFTKTLDNVAKGQHRQITFNLVSNPALPPEEIGAITNDGEGITIDSSIIEDEPIISDYEWFEEILDNTGRPGEEGFEGTENPDQPTPNDPTDPDDGDPIEFVSTTLDLEGINRAADFPEDGSKPADVDILAKKGIAHLDVYIISQSLNEDMLSSIGLSTHFDLAYPGALNDVLHNNFRFPTGDEIIGKTKVNFNIAPFVPLLNIFAKEVHKFRVVVTDQAGNVDEVTLSFQS